MSQSQNIYTCYISLVPTTSGAYPTTTHLFNFLAQPNDKQIYNQLITNFINTCLTIFNTFLSFDVKPVWLDYFKQQIRGVYDGCQG